MILILWTSGLGYVSVIKYEDYEYMGCEFWMFSDMAIIIYEAH